MAADLAPRPRLRALLAIVPLIWGERFILGLVTRAMIMAIAALSLDLILGYGALVSFGHAAFLGIGAYAVAILFSHDIVDASIAFPVAILAGALFALVTGAISLKTRGVYFIMITLAFGQMALFTATSLSAYGGDDGLRMFHRSEVFGSRLLANDTTFYFVVLGTLLGCFLLLKAIVASRFGGCAAGGQGERAADARARLRSLPLSPRRLCAGAICARWPARSSPISACSSPPPT